MSLLDTIKRVLGIGWRARMRNLETRVARVEGAVAAFDQLGRDVERMRR